AWPRSAKRCRRWTAACSRTRRWSRRARRRRNRCRTRRKGWSRPSRYSVSSATRHPASPLAGRPMSRPNPIVPRWPSTGPDSGREGYARHRRWVTGAFGLVGLVLLLAVGNPGLAEATLLVTTIGMLLVAVAATVAICRRRVRRMDEAFDADESRWFGINAHRRVRITVYAVLLTVGLHVVLQAWNARLLETERVEGAEIIDLAAAQRMYSQRIGRLAAKLLSREGGFDATRDELANALAGSNDAAIRLEGLLRRKG